MFCHPPWEIKLSHNPSANSSSRVDLPRIPARNLVLAWNALTCSWEHNQRKEGKEDFVIMFHGSSSSKSVFIHVHLFISILKFCVLHMFRIFHYLLWFHCFLTFHAFLSCFMACPHLSSSLAYFLNCHHCSSCFIMFIRFSSSITLHCQISSGEESTSSNLCPGFASGGCPPKPHRFVAVQSIFITKQTHASICRHACCSPFVLVLDHF